jgi:hypothetical protein
MAWRGWPTTLSADRNSESSKSKNETLSVMVIKDLLVSHLFYYPDQQTKQPTRRSTFPSSPDSPCELVGPALLPVRKAFTCQDMFCQLQVLQLTHCLSKLLLLSDKILRII